jgi:LacI family transcriptional regulator
MATVTIRDVARLAGVSIATVSQALSGHRPVNQETAARVLTAVTQLGYRPNRVAASMVTGTTGTLGLVVPDIANPFFASLVKAVESAAIAWGHTTIACSSERNKELQERYLDLLLDRQVDALLYVGDYRRVLPRLERIAGRGTSIVLLDRIGTGPPPFRSVSTDHVAGGALVANHLLDLGHRRIGVIAGPRRESTSGARLRGFRAALAKRGVALSADAIYHARDFTLEEGAEAVERLLATDPRITALFCENDLIALGTIRVAHKRGFDVPRDVSIVGFDDIFVSSLVTPALTTVRQPIAQLGSAAVDMAVRLRDATLPAPENIVLPVQLIVRESSARAMP